MQAGSSPSHLEKGPLGPFSFGQACLAASLVLGLWLVARPYAGLRHDGILYLGQALLHQQPEVFSADLFFAHGSQDSFTVFSRGLSWLYARWDIAPIQVAVLATCQALLLVGTWLLLEPLDHRRRWLSLAALAVMSHQYGGHGIFAFAERFVSARTLAEPLALLVLVALVRRRWVLAGAALLATLAVHPLVAVGIGAVGWSWLVLQDRRWLAAAAIMPVVWLAAALGVAPLDRLLTRFDDAWWAVVRQVSGHVLLQTWPSADLLIAGFDLGLLGLAARHGLDPLRRVLQAVILATLLLLIASVLGADVAHNVLVTQLQLWRVLWLVHLLALALLPALVLQAWQSGGMGRVTALSLVAAAVACYPRWPTAWAFVALAAAAVWLQARPHNLRPRTVRALVVGLGLVVAGLTAGVAAANHALLADAGSALTHQDFTLLAATLPSLSMLLAVGLLGLATSGRVLPPPGGPAVAWVLVAVVVGYGVWNWDRRTLMVRAVENGLHAPHPFRAHIPPRAQVYWVKEPAATWVLLRRASHWSVDQGSGLLFNRETALEFARRREPYHALELQERVCRLASALNVGEGSTAADCAPTPEILQRLCRAERGPDFLVFPRRYDGAIADWTVDPGSSAPLTWTLHDCTQLR